MQMPGAGMPAGQMPGAGAPAPGGTTGQGRLPETEMSEEDMRNDINLKMGDLKNQKNAIETKGQITQNELEAVKGELVKAVFGMLEQLGVDPTSMESIQQFIQTLEQEDPDLLALFTAAFEALTGSPAAQGIAQGMVGPGAGIPTPPGLETAGQVAPPMPEDPMGPAMGANIGANPPAGLAPEAPMSPGGGPKFNNVKNAMGMM